MLGFRVKSLGFKGASQRFQAMWGGRSSEVGVFSFPSELGRGLQSIDYREPSSITV